MIQSIVNQRLTVAYPLWISLQEGCQANVEHVSCLAEYEAKKTTLNQYDQTRSSADSARVFAELIQASVQNATKELITGAVIQLPIDPRKQTTVNFPAINKVAFEQIAHNFVAAFHPMSEHQEFSHEYSCQDWTSTQ